MSIRDGHNLFFLFLCPPSLPFSHPPCYLPGKFPPIHRFFSYFHSRATGKLAICSSKCEFGTLYDLTCTVYVWMNNRLRKIVFIDGQTDKVAWKCVRSVLTSDDLSVQRICPSRGFVRSEDLPVQRICPFRGFVRPDDLFVF